MEIARRKRLTERARIVKALAHPARLLIIEELTHREYCVCELQAMVGSDMSTVSRHLSVLRQAGLVEDDKRGLMVYYRLKTPSIMKFMESLEAAILANASP